MTTYFKAELIARRKQGHPRRKISKRKPTIAGDAIPQRKRRRKEPRTAGETSNVTKRASEQTIKDMTQDPAPRESSVTLSEYVEHYLGIREASGAYAPHTLATVRSRLGALTYLIGDTPLQNLGPRILESAYADMRAGASRSGRQLSRTFVCEVHESTSTMMERAVKEGVLTHNPCREAQPPKRDTKEKRALTNEQIAHLLRQLDCTRAEHCAVALYLTQGLRRGEACALSRGDVDLPTHTLHVCRNLDIYGNLKTTKTGAGVRYLPLSEFAYNALESRMRTVIELMHKVAPDNLTKQADGSSDVKADVPIICNGRGERMKPCCISSWWARHRAELGLGGWTLHELRYPNQNKIPTSRRCPALDLAA